MSAATVRAHLVSSLNERLTTTLRLQEAPSPVTVATGITALDLLTSGLPRGALSEITGPSSSGRTGVMLAALAGATQCQEACALVDASDSFDPHSAAEAGVELDRLLWVRCCAEIKGRQRISAPQRNGLGRLEQVLKVTDLLLQSGGFGMVVLDMGNIVMQSMRRVPLTSWFRFRRTVENTATVLLLVEQEPCAQTCASLVLRLERESLGARDSVEATSSSLPNEWHIVKRDAPLPKTNPVTHATVLQGMQLHAQVLRSWKHRKPMHSVGARFELCAAR